MPILLGIAVGHIRYRFALAVIGFGVFFGWLLACVIPLCVCASYFDLGGPLSEASKWTLTGTITLTAAALTYRCRKWIVRKASEEAPPEPVSATDGATVAIALIQMSLTVLGSLLAVIATLIGLIIAGLLAYGAYLLLTMLSVPIAILIGAIIIAVAVLAAAHR